MNLASYIFMKAGKQERDEMMIINDENYLIELRKRNPKALEYIIDTYSNLVFKVVTNVLGNENYESSKECVNDIYLLVWNKHQLYNPEKSSFKNWLLAISKYKAIDYKRALKKEDNMELEEDTLLARDNIESEYIFKEKKSEIIKLLHKESDLDKEIFIRRYILDEDINSIAQRVSLSKGAVYNRLWRLRNSLIKEFEVSKEMEEVK